ncbi:hypothetical protein G195_001094 [Phytophthora kernoviae 00238/432]|uniref:Probable transcriptional regulator ycf27 n=1 Tax=Phytophthora kernoviae 00238/432 TaxID=1284355 RepID=A0A8J4WB08_9STRA|nr:hypothetical protein G195_001094 [Phytophthora kernoviae 00238/432]
MIHGMERNNAVAQPATILLVDDEQDIIKLMEIYFGNEGYRVLTASDGIEALEQLKKEPIDLIILDVMMPNMDGIEACMKIREEQKMPIIMLSAKSMDMDKITGLSIGADDYVTKPFNPLELVARAKSQLRRYHTFNEGRENKEHEWVIDDLVINTDTHEIWVDEQPVRLTPREFAVLELLARHQGSVLSMEQIYRQVWKEEFMESNNTVMVHIRKIREKIELDSKHPKFIQTVWGVGLMLVLDEITAGIQEVAKGELSHRIEVKTSDEFGVVAASINQMAEQLQLSLQEERSAVAAKNDLITGISHDLRTPLTSILGFLEYIEKDRYQDEIEMRYYVSIAYEKSLTLRKLIDDLFEYTRVSGGSLPLSLTSLNLNPFLMQLAEEFAPMLEEAGMTYKIIGGQEPLWIQAAPGELVRAYENLFSNAIRYGAQGKVMEIALSLEGEEAVVRISNYGEPIPIQDLPHLFDRFYRVDKSRSRDTGGTGLGLAIAKSMIELHQGSIAAYSEQGRTDFVTRFPVTAAPMNRDQAEQ